MSEPAPNRNPSKRLRRGVAVAVVVLLHVVVISIVLTMRSPREKAEEKRAREPVLAMILDESKKADRPAGPTEDEQNLQRLAPKFRDFPVELEPPEWVITLDLPESAPVAQESSVGMAGEAADPGGISGEGYSIKLLRRAIPRYPPGAARRQEEGVTGVALHVNSKGAVDSVKVIGSSGFRELDEAAVDAFRKWKFAPLPSAAPADGVWLRTEQRFIHYRYQYSRLGDVADRLSVSEIKAPAEEATPGSEDALTRFIRAVRSGDFTSVSGLTELNQIRKMRSALESWGAVTAIDFTGMAGERRWTAYSPDDGGPRVDVAWNLFEVRHQHATVEWMVGVDRQGRVWSASASPAPWM